MPSPGPSHLSRVSIHPDSQAHLQLIGLPGLPLGQEESLASRQHRKSEVLCFPAGTQTTKRRLPGFLVIQKDALTPPFLEVRVRKPQFTITPRDLPEPLFPIYCFCRFSGGLAEEGCTQHLAQHTSGERVTHQGSHGTQEPPKGPPRTAGPAREKGVSCWGHWGTHLAIQISAEQTLVWQPVVWVP